MLACLPQVLASHKLAVIASRRLQCRHYARILGTVSRPTTWRLSTCQYPLRVDNLIGNGQRQIQRQECSHNTEATARFLSSAIKILPSEANFPPSSQWTSYTQMNDFCCPGSSYSLWVTSPRPLWSRRAKRLEASSWWFGCDGWCRWLLMSPSSRAKQKSKFNLLYLMWHFK